VQLEPRPTFDDRYRHRDAVDTDEFASNLVGRDKRDEIEKWILEEGWLVSDEVHYPMGRVEALVMGDSRRTGLRGLVAKRAS
jgi:hypothetical protein